MRPALRSLVVFAVATFAAQAATAQQVENPVACAGGAENLALAYGDHTTGCAVETAPPLDEFTFVASAGDEWRAHVLSGTIGLDLAIELRDPNGTLIVDGFDVDADAWCQGNPAGAVTCSFQTTRVLTLSGTYTLVVHDVNDDDAGSYSIGLNCLSGTCAAQPANQPVGYDTSVTDSVLPGVDADFFEFNAASGSIVRFHILSTTLGFDPAIEVRDATGTVLVDGFDVDPAWCQGNPAGAVRCSFSFDLPIASTEIHTLLIHDVSNDDSGDYLLSIHCLSGACPANPVAPLLRYGVSETSDLTPQGDADAYVFSAEAGTMVRFHVLSTTNGLDPAIEVRDATGTVLVDGFDVDPAWCQGNPAGAVRCSFSFDLPIASTEIHTLLIHDVSNNDGGGYQIELLCLSGGCPGAPSPNRLTYDAAQNSNLTPPVDGDFLIFGGTGGSIVRLNVLSTTNGFDPAIEVRDPNGAVIVDGFDADAAWCQGNPSGAVKCSFSFDVAIATSGQYRLLVHDVGNNDVGGYKISLWCLSGVCDSDFDGVFDIAPLSLAYGASVTTESLDPQVDGDNYRFDGTDGSQITIDVTSKAFGLDPAIEIRDPSGVVIVDGFDADGDAWCQGNPAGAVKCSFSTTRTLSASGTFELLIHDVGVNDQGGYDLTLSCTGGACGSLPPAVSADNCTVAPNGPNGGTCTVSADVVHVIGGKDQPVYGTACTVNAECGIGGVCSLAQEDADTDSDGDACDDACNDGIDNDLDTMADFAGGDLGCASATSALENPECSDGIDNDDDGNTDGSDVHCGSPTKPAKNREAKPVTCGLGPELVLVLPVLGWISSRRRRRNSNGSYGSALSG